MPAKAGWAHGRKVAKRLCHHLGDGIWPAWWWVRARALEPEVPVFKSSSLFLAVTLCRLPTISGLQQFPVLHGVNNDAGKDGRQEEKGATEDEMVG